MVVIPLLGLFVPFPEHMQRSLLKGAWFVATSAALLHSLVSLRYLLKTGLFDKVIYIVLLLPFLAILTFLLVEFLPPET
jgi:hypothetical protein